MSLLNFGEFQIDVNLRRIYNTSGELAVEPKMLDVLCYLIQHSDRYVSLQELHAEVWAGRVVTDTAVRRTISKLRSVLGDTETETPIYIKSQMKRGYQFIGKQLPADLKLADSISTMASDSSLVSTNTLQTKTRKPRTTLIWFGITSAVLLMLVCLYYFFTASPKHWQMTTDPLVTLAGEKYFLSVSDDGRYQGFTGRLSKIEGWQPYVYDRQLGHLQKINMPKKTNSPIVSIVSNQHVIVTTSLDGYVHLFMFAITNLNTPIKSIRLNEFVDVGQAVSYKNNAILVSLKKEGENGVYYVLNLEDEKLEQFTFSSNRNSIDSNLVISPDKKHFAFVRRDFADQVQIYRTIDKALVFEESFEFSELSNGQINLVWFDNEKLLLKSNQQSQLINISNDSKVLLPNSQLFTGLARDENGNFFGLLKTPQHKEFIELPMPKLSSAQSYFNFTDQIQSVNYSHLPDSLWLVEYDKAHYQLHRYQPSSGEKKFYFKIEEPFEFVAEGYDSSYLLLLHNKQLKMLELSSGKLTSISYENQNIRVVGVNPSHDDKTIFFSEKSGGEWQINAFDRTTKTQKRVLNGYIMLMPWERGFVTTDAKGKFYLLDAEYKLIKQLPLEIDLKRKHHISVRGNELIVAQIGADAFWRISALNLVTEQHQQHLSTNLPIKTKFSFKNDGTAAIVETINDDENQLVSVGYNFGYN
jgi:DNA-binding winged helix-turn-helix (wHTH) protein/Tol biopolymer transport system component